jgi:UDP-glucose 4-epimerase
MIVVITGVAGFIGSNLSKRLIDAEHQVIGLDNFSHGDVDNLKGIIGKDGFTFREHDVTIPFTIGKADMIIHLASEKIPRYSNSFDTINNNHEMVINAVRASLETGARLVFASTSDIYGKNENGPFAEDDALVMGGTDVKRWAYAVSKMHSEHYIIAAHDRFKLDYTILRFFSCYGENQAPGWWGGVQSAFIDNVLTGRELEIHGDGMQTRCFTYIDDAVDGIMLAINSEKSRNEIFNIGNPATATSMRALARLIFSISNKEVPIKSVPYEVLGRYEDTRSKVPNIAKAKQVLGFNPKWSLYDGLKKTIEWQINQHKNDNGK